MVGIAPLTRSAAGKPPLVLYSTQTFLKFRIQHDFIGRHRVWCSPVFDAEKQNRYALGASLAPSSDPASIYRDLAQAVKRSDDHNAKIASQKTVLGGLAIDWHTNRHISEEQRDDIIAIIKHSPITEWKPLILVVPFAPVAKRVKNVPRKDRASSEPEYIIDDLVAEEFDIIEAPT